MRIFVSTNKQKHNTMEIGSTVLNGKYTVTGIKYIQHGKFYPNTKIAAEFFVTGQRGATYKGYLRTDGTYRVEKGFGQTRPQFEGIVIYNATTNELTTPIAVV